MCVHLVPPDRLTISSAGNNEFVLNILYPYDLHELHATCLKISLNLHLLIQNHEYFKCNRLTIPCDTVCLTSTLLFCVRCTVGLC